jgi:predicted dehydrogenase
MPSVIRWGLLGTARINQAIIPRLHEGARHELVAVASRDADRAAHYAREWSIPRAFGSYDALLADPGIDVVYIPLPNALHAEWSVRAMRAGKHVLCEKPLALTVAEVELLGRVARETGRIVTEAFMYRHHPQTHAVRAMVADGAIGEPRLVRGGFSFSLTRPGNVRLDPDLGGGALWDLGCYPVSHARYVLGREPVEACCTQVVGETGVDLTSLGHLRFEHDAMCQFDCSFRAAPRASIEIVGTEGTIDLATPYKPGLRESIVLRRDGGTEIRHVEGAPLYAGELDDMASAALDGAAPAVSLADSLGNTAALAALQESARLNRVVPVARAAPAEAS